LFISHVEDYGHWIPQDPVGKKRESHRILQESNGNSRKWKQYSHRKFVGFFPVDSSQFPVLSGRNWSGIIGKNPKIFRWEYCFHVPVISDDFLPEPAHNFRPGIGEKRISFICFTIIKNKKGIGFFTNFNDMITRFKFLDRKIIS